MAQIRNSQGEPVGHHYYATPQHAVTDAIERLKKERFGTTYTVYDGDVHTHSLTMMPLDERRSHVIISDLWPQERTREATVR